MKKISVYGGTGFIGSNFCSLFPDNSIVIPRNNREPESNEILYFLSTVNNYNVFSDPSLDINTNLNILIETLESCKQKYDTDFIFNYVSTWFVYGDVDLPAKEDACCSPRGFYSITKRAAEQLLISYCLTFGIKYRIMRLCNVYGTGDSKTSKKKNAFQYLATEVAEGRDINLYNNGKDLRDFMHVEDVSRALKLIVDKGNSNEIYNVASGESNDFITTMTYVKNKTNSLSNFNFIDPPHFHKVVQAQDIRLDNSKLKKLGFEQKISITQGLDEIINNIK